MTRPATSEEVRQAERITGMSSIHGDTLDRKTLADAIEAERRRLERRSR
jgi:hypothetical protein